MQSLMSEKKIVFVDLDLTLFDYTISRSAAALAALHELQLSWQDEPYKIYSNIVDHWRGFLLMGFPNLRQQWNEKSIYYLTIVLTNYFSNPQRSNFYVFLDLLAKTHTADEIQSLKFQNKLLLNNFYKVYNSIVEDSDVQSKVQRASNRFEDETTNLAPFPFARSFLSNLISKKNFCLFVATEGDQEIQWTKIKKLGLEDLVSESNFLTTDGFSNPQKILTSFNHIKANLIKKELNPYSLKLKIDSLQYLEEQFQNFKYKKDKHFFGHAIHVAIKRLLGGYSDTEFPNISSNDWENLPNIKVATFGDRYLNDIKPIVDIFGQDRVFSIRMLYGKYLFENTKDTYLEPDFSVNELNVALTLLLDEKNWLNKQSIERPKHFYFDVNKKNTILRHASIALTIPPPVSSMAEALLQDLMITDEKINSFRGRLNEEFSKSGIDDPVEEKIINLIESLNIS